MLEAVFPAKGRRESSALAALALACSVVLLSAACAGPALQRREYEALAMGTTFRVVLYGANEAEMDRAAREALARVQRLDELLSDYRPESELSRLSARSRESAPTPPIALGPELLEVLTRAPSLARASGGAFDVTVGPIVELWRRAARQELLPEPERIAAAMRAVGHAKLELDPFARTARLLARDMRLDLGGIAKGYACDEALELLVTHGFPRALVAGGGDVRVGTAPPDRGGWRIAVAPLGEGEAETCIEIANAAVSTSGDRYRHVEIDGVRYSHVVDPATGLGLTRRMGATVVTGDGTSADALATALCVLGPERGVALAADLGAEARLVVLEKEGWRTCESAGWTGIMSDAHASAPALDHLTHSASGADRDP